MSPRARRGFRALFVVMLLGGVGAFLIVGENQPPEAAPPPAGPPPEPPAAPPQVAGAQDEKLKRFQAGIDLGKERAGFSGLPMVQIFVDERVDKAALDDCLESPGIRELMPSYTGILISSEEEDASPRGLRRKGEHQVIVRRVNGKVLGVLPPGFTCGELQGLLETSARRMIIKPKRSPVYRRLLESPDAIDRLLERGEADRARKFVDFLKELEGKDHPAALAAEARLAGR